MSFIDEHYANLLSAHLRNFKKVKTGLYNFSCPLCGDSQKNKRKARGYLYKVRNDLFYKCHNCGAGKTFGNLLKEVNPPLYDEFIIERYKSGLTGKNSNTPEPVFNFPKPKFEKNILSNLSKISDLDSNHIAKKYLDKRQIPVRFYNKLYYVNDFGKWLESHSEKKYPKFYGEQRIVIPFFTEDKKLSRFQARAISENAYVRYFTKTIDSDLPKLYGLDVVDKDKLIYCTEGPFDSMFLDNGVAIASSTLDPTLYLPEDKIVMVYDNEPRNPQIVNSINQYIIRGIKVVIWPSYIEEKDINAMYLSGYPVESIIKERTFEKLEAMVKFTEWKKV